MSDNPYAPPLAAPDVVAPRSETEIPEEILKKIKTCWVAGLVSVVLTTVFTLISMFGADVLGLDAWAFVDVAIMAGLTYGVSRKSRVCAILLFSFFLLGKIIIWSQTGMLNGMFLAVIFLYCFAQGIVGTFQYHTFKTAGERDIFA